MPDREKVIDELKELCEYLFHEYKVCYHGDAEDTYNRFLIANNALELLKDQCDIIRCKDCKYWKNKYMEYDVHPWLPCMVINTRGNWFCANGERR